jgi:hypothetical protein
MSLLKALNILSAILGAIGTALLFKGSFAYEQMSYMDTEDFAITKGIARRNRWRRNFQNTGLALILASFVLAGISATLA